MVASVIIGIHGLANKPPAAGAENRHLAVLHRAHDEKIRHDIEVIRPFHRISDLDRRDQVPVALRLIDVGFPQGADPILQHIARGRVDQPERQTCLIILGRGNPVEAVLGEKVGPALELIGVETLDVISKELLQYQLKNT